MDETTNPETTSRTTGAEPPSTRTGVPWGVMLVLLVIAFGVGFGWQFYEATTVRGELSAAQQELEVERLRIQLGQAALAAHSGDFEAARTQMSDFFTQLQEKAPAMPAEVRRVAEDFLNMRDEVITGLSRSNPEYAAVLYGMVEELGQAITWSRGEVPDGSPGQGGPPPAAGDEPAGDQPGEAEPEEAGPADPEG